MAMASGWKLSAKQASKYGSPSSNPKDSVCTRCGGLMVHDYFMDLPSSTGESDCAAKRCVQCGEVVDPVIRLNRQGRYDSMAVQICERKR